MPAAAAAAVTSGSLAAPSSIEYSVCTCRCTKESDGVVLTGGGAPQWSRLPATGEAAGDRRGRPAVRTGRRYGVEAVRVGAGGAPILALRTVYSQGLTERVSPPPGPALTPAPP